MRIAICDDCIEDCRHIQAMLERYAAEHGADLSLSLFANAEDMLHAARGERFTHYFLDIIMPCMDGITAAQELRSFDSDACLIFLTSSNEYAYQSYRVRATDYLLKPVQADALHMLMDRLISRHAEDEDSICIQTGRSFFRIPLARLSHLEVSQKRLHFHMADGEVRDLPGTMAEIEKELLTRSAFVKIHRSYIVNLRQISVLSPEGCIMFSGKNLPVSRLLYNQVRSEYMAHLFGHAEV